MSWRSLLAASDRVSDFWILTSIFTIFCMIGIRRCIPSPRTSFCTAPKFSTTPLSPPPPRVDLHEGIENQEKEKHRHRECACHHFFTDLFYRLFHFEFLHESLLPASGIRRIRSRIVLVGSHRAGKQRVVWKWPGSAAASDWNGLRQGTNSSQKTHGQI